MAFRLVHTLSWVRDERDNKGKSVHGLVLVGEMCIRVNKGWSFTSVLVGFSVISSEDVGLPASVKTK